MNKLLSCHYNMDTNRVEARFEDGTTLAIDCIAVEDEYGKDGNRDDSQAKQTISENSQIKKAVDEINKKAHNSEAVFGIHDATNRVTIKIVDKDTKKVLKEYPPEKTLDMIAKVWEMAGLLVDKKL